MPIDVTGLRPDVYSEINFELENPIIPANTRFPMVVGPADEHFNVPATELVRYGINPISKYDLSLQVDGQTKQFTVPSSYLPIVDSVGNVSADPKSITVWSGGKKRQVKEIEGATGIFSLSEILPVGSDLFVSFAFDDLDMEVSTDLLSQVDGTNTVFYVDQLYIVDGSNRGIITNDPSNITLLVDDAPFEVASLDGASGKITTKIAIPNTAASASVTFYRAFPRQYDYVPEHKRVLEIEKVGSRPDAADYIRGTQYVVKTLDGFNIIVWGSSILIDDKVKDADSDGIKSVLQATVHDDFIMNEELTDVDFTVKNGFTKSQVRDGSHLDKVTQDPSLVITRESATGSVETSSLVDTIYVLGDSKEIKFASTIPSGKIYSSYYRNVISNNTFSVKVTAKGGIGTGKYSLLDKSDVVIPHVIQGTHNLVGGPIAPEFPGGIFDGRVTPGKAVLGTYNLTFTSSKEYSVEFDDGVTPVVIGTGELDQTFEDLDRAVFWTIITPTLGTYQSGNILAFEVTDVDRDVSASPVFDIPGVQLILNTTADLEVDDLSEIATYNIETPIPSGTYYYLKYKIEKNTILNPLFLTRQDYLNGNVPIFVGEKNLENTGVLGVEAAFEAGSPYVLFLQSYKNSLGFSGSPEYEQARAVWEKGFENKSDPYYIVPMTINSQILQTFKNTSLQLSSYRYGRESRVYMSVDPTLSYREIISFVEGFSNVRISLFYPGDPVIDFVDDEGNVEEFQVSPAVIPAVIAGLRSSGLYNISESLVGDTKAIPYIKKVNTTLYEPFNGQLDLVGVSILINEDGVVKFWNESTTDASSVKTKEPTVIESVDDLAKTARKACKSEVGEYAADDSSVEKIMKAVLSNKITANIISDYANLTISADPNDPRVTRVKVKVFVPSIRKWIAISFVV